MDHQAFWLTLQLAGATTVILMAIALPLAWWLSSGRSVMRSMVQAVVMLPLVLPPTVIGFYLLILLGPLTAPGRLLIRVVGHPLAFTFSGLLLGSLVYSLPFAVQPIVAGFRSVEKGYVEAALMLGLSPWRTFSTVVLPMSRGSLATAAVLAFTHTVGEFGVVLMLGGNIPGSTRTLSIEIYDKVQELDYTAANRTAGLLMVFAFVMLTTIYLVPRFRQANDGDVLG